MSPGAVVFLVVSWTFVLGLTLWSFAMVLRHARHFDPDGIGPGVPPEPGRRDPAAGPVAAAPPLPPENS